MSPLPSAAASDSHLHVPTASRPGDLFRYAIEAMHDALYVLDESGNIIFSNASAERSFGKAEECYGHPLFGSPWQLLKENGAPLPGQAFPVDVALKSGEPYHETLGVNQPGREMRWLAVHIVPIRRPGEDSATMALVTLRDITEEKRARDLLVQREAYFRSLIENSYDVITVLDTDGTICFESPSVQRVLGYTPAELLGKPAFDYVHPDDRARVLAAFRSRVEHPDIKQATVYRALHRDGSWVSFETVSTFQASEANRTRVILNSRQILKP